MAEKQAANAELLGMFRSRREPAATPTPERPAKAPEPPPQVAEGVGQGAAPIVAPEPKAAPRKASVERVPPRTARRAPVEDETRVEMVDRKLRLPKRTLDRLRAAAAYSTPHTSLGRLAAEAIDAHIDQLEKRRGEKFPTLQGELPPGRRVGT